MNFTTFHHNNNSSTYIKVERVTVELQREDTLRNGILPGETVSLCVRLVPVCCVYLKPKPVTTVTSESTPRTHES